MSRLAALAAFIVVAFSEVLWADERPAIRDTQAETIRLTPPAEALASWRPPEGFQVSLCAAEPQVQQPIALATDARGRLWIAENYSYAERAVNFDDAVTIGS